MATERLRFFRPDSTTGGDGTEDRTDGATRAYASMSAALAAEGADLVTADVFLTLRCTVSGTDTTFRADFNGYTTDVTRYLAVECTGAAKFKGVSVDRDGTGYKLDYGGTGTLLVLFREDFCRITGVEVHSQGALVFGTTGTPGAGADIQVKQCGIMYDGANSTSYGFAPGAWATVSLENTLIVGPIRSMDARSPTACTIDHCGFESDRDLGLVADASVTVTNTWADGHTNQCFWTGGSSPSGSHNASSDASVSTDFTNSVASFTNTAEMTSPSMTFATFDFALKDSNLNAAGTGSLAVDIADTTRSGTQDIGPFDFTAAGGGGGIVLFRRRIEGN